MNFQHRRHLMTAERRLPFECVTLERVDVLVNNAGIQHVSPIEDFPAEKWNAINAVNLSSAFHAIRGVTPGNEELR